MVVVKLGHVFFSVFLSTMIKFTVFSDELPQMRITKTTATQSTVRP